MKKIGNRWVDANNNSWDCDIYTNEQAEVYSATLVNCMDCMDCSYCSNCRDCRGCRGCSNCRGCRGCSNCSNCRGWNTNPQRIISPKLGSRGSNTTIYFDSERAWVVCGCYKGDIEAFKSKIKETHGNNEHAKGYYKWIKRVENYMKG